MVKRSAFGLALLVLIAVLVWQGIFAAGNPDPLSVRPGSAAGILDIGVLVFREGLECILVLAAITAGMTRTGTGHQKPIATGVSLGFLATIFTWFMSTSVVDNLSQHISALELQAWTGLLAISVLLVVMNWFFHKVYWTGWISMHNKRKHRLLRESNCTEQRSSRVFWGLALLGFSSFFREGVEVVLFLQGYRLRFGTHVVLRGVVIGTALTVLVGVLTFVSHRKLPYKRMLVITGVMLGAVLLVMVGEQIQEMQLAGWLPVTPIPWLSHRVPPWAGLWFSIFPNFEGIAAQGFAAAVVLGSYFLARNSKPTAVSNRRVQAVGLVSQP